MAEVNGATLVGVIHSDEMDSREMLGRADSLPGWMAALGAGGVPVICERFIPGGPFEDEWMLSTSTAAMMAQLLPRSPAQLNNAAGLVRPVSLGMGGVG